jgi:hypothetical protein
MKNRIRKIATYSIATIFCGMVCLVLLYLSTPIPKSAPLTNQAGIVLDAKTQSKLIEIVFEAARHDDDKTIREYLAEGFSPNVRNPRGDTLLIVAAYNDSPHIVATLLAHPQIEIEARNRMGLTAISAAAFKGFEEPLRLLIQHGANVNAANGSRQTAIMFAALAGRTNAIKILLAAGADARQADSHGNTPLSLAITQGATESEVLLKTTPAN